MCAALFFQPAYRMWSDSRAAGSETELRGVTDDDVYLFTELSAAYRNGFYPGVTQYAARLKAQYPHSVLYGRASLYAGESYFHLGRNDLALAELSDAERFTAGDNELSARCFYWKGRTLFRLGRYAEAAAGLYQAALQSGQSGALYAPAVLYAGKSCVLLERYDQAVPLLEYVISHGSLYTAGDYSNSCELLFNCYNKLAQYDKLCTVYDRLASDGSSANRRPAAIDGAAWLRLTLQAGDADQASGRYRRAYERYCSVLSADEPGFAVIALPKAYAVSAAHKAETGQNTGDVLALVSQTLSDYPALICEFWVRLGLDSYNEGNIQKADEYLNNAAALLDGSSGFSDRLVQTIYLYRAEIVYKKAAQSAAAGTAAGTAAAAAAELLGSCPVLPGADDPLYAAYQTSFARYAGLMQDWGKCRYYTDLASLSDGTAVDPTVAYWKALSEFNTGYYDLAQATLELPSPGTDVPVYRSADNLMKLYGTTLAARSLINEALPVFSDLSRSGSLDGDSRADYAKVLLLSGKYAEAYTEAGKSSSIIASYIAGLAAFNDGRWSAAADSLSAYLKAGAQEGQSKFTAYALFYRGYARYRSGSYADAVSDLSDFIKMNPSHALAWDAYITTAYASLQLRKFDAAAAAAESAVACAPDTARRQESLLLCAGIYADSARYDKAAALLQEYADKKDSFAQRCLFQLAQIYVKKGDVARADDAYGTIAARFSSAPLAEEASYRRGELFYGAGDYGTGAQRFASYIKAYPDGRFIDAALYFGAYCLSQSGDHRKAALQYTVLLDSYPGSTYRYDAMKQSVSLLRDDGDYDGAVAVAEKQLAEFGTQAEADGVKKQIAELRQLAAGGNEAVVRKKAEYEEKGGSTTQAGRTAGTELVALYGMSSDEASRRQAAALAETLLPAQKARLKQEHDGAARNARFLGDYYRSTGRAEKSAALYLEAAEYFRMSGDGDAAATALYGAVESFDAAGRYGDAKSSAETLRSLYPGSRQAAAAAQIVER